ncbi:MucB/RseB C-terminal domain-containing protein [Herbaspirillum sp. LeCh32-8]|uniref:MucB/RseB C-terminal domain-containing protein n=1 Tax=Herbaspirillum sp. LeCh32-8 TaxID=2821356 RepID=UPI001AE68C67|nr:MucB/RseB C-terminal domain-containing protein [Herbaspirillum sp. LeCh32-8]MBP0596855.1 MucB/RseB C-terminal domain-containing protein [Herbaspirillum sp. LeCh32-8]
MQRTGHLLGLISLLSVFLAPSAQAADGAPAVADEAAASSAQAQLKKLQSAAQRLSYSGTFVYQQANQMRTSRITHVLAGKNELEKLEVLDGKPREYLRNNDDVACYIPEAKTVLIEKRVTRDVFPAILGASPEDLANHYNVSMGPEERVAGRDCQAIVLEPRDKLRYGYRFWADKQTGLLLRAQTLDGRGEVVEQISFTQVEIGPIDRARVRPSYADTHGWRVERAAMSQVDLSAWNVTPPSGFRKIQEVRRLISDTPPSGAAPAQSKPSEREVSQIVFSDGLAAISVFIEPGSQNRNEGAVQQGAMNIVGRRQGDYWLTVVGEVPAAAIRQVSNSIELKSK